MSKSIATYWNPLNLNNSHQWKPILGLEGMAEELTLSIDQDTGEYTRLTRFHPNADTTQLPLVAKAIPTLKKYSSSVVACTIAPLIYGWKAVIMPVDHLTKFMGHLRLTLDAWC